MKFASVLPEDVGMSSTRLLKARDHAQRVGDELGGTGGAVLMVRHDKIVGEWYWGTRGPHNAHPFDADTLVPLYSVTKGFTAIALSLLIEDGTLWLDEPAYRHVPELLGDDPATASAQTLAQITVRHLATHSSGFPAGDLDFYGCWRDRRPDESLPETYFRHAIARVTRGVVFEPGASHIYSDPAVTVLGEIIFRASGQRVPDLLQERVFQPLGLHCIGWDFPEELVRDIADIVNVDWMNHIPDARQARQVGSVAGGLISNARDLAVCGAMLLHEGELDGVRVVAPLTVRMMTTCQFPLPGRPNYPHRGLFWWIKAAPDTPELGTIVPNGTYCHGGAGHSVLVIMPALDLVAVMLRNRAGDPPGFLYNRDYPMFMDLVAASVVR